MKIKVRESPLLFSGPMVRAILEGRKTQTRRVLKPQPYIDGEYPDGVPMWFWECPKLDAGYCHTGEDAMRRLILQCGPQVGDLIWVRETWAPTDHTINDQPGVVYQATDPGWGTLEGFKWRRSIFMPRWASRLILRLTGVRVERLQEISEADAQAEGVGRLCPADIGFDCGWGSVPKHLRQPLELFRQLWDSINAKKHPWSSNPWVLVREFEIAEVKHG